MTSWPRPAQAMGQIPLVTDNAARPTGGATWRIFAALSGPITGGSHFRTNQGTIRTSSKGYSGYCYDAGLGKGLVMGYYDGNTVTALWNYAQNFSMSDNSYDTSFGPSALGASECGVRKHLLR